jgi:MFS family permease
MIVCRLANMRRPTYKNLLNYSVLKSVDTPLLNIGGSNPLALYCIAAVFASLSIIPLTLTRSHAPIFSEPETLSIKAMIKISPSGVVACFISGLMLGSLYGLYPIFIQKSGYSLSQVSTIMGLTILGGMAFQYPLGRLSDSVSRRYVIACLALASIMLCFVLLIFGKSSVYVMALFSFLLGGAIFCLYPIGISHACDRVQSHQIVSATQTLLLAYGLGATFGPIIAPLFNWVSKVSGLLIFIVVACISLSIFMLWRKQVEPSVPDDEKHDFIMAAEMTPIANEMDPRAD